MEKFGDFFTAAAAVARLRSARIGSLGYPFPGMGDFAVDTTHMAATLGCAVDGPDGRRLHQRAAPAPAAEVARLMAEYRATMSSRPDLTEADLTLTARVDWLALARLWIIGVWTH